MISVHSMSGVAIMASTPPPLRIWGVKCLTGWITFEWTGVEEGGKSHSLPVNFYSNFFTIFWKLCLHRYKIRVKDKNWKSIKELKRSGVCHPPLQKNWLNSPLLWKECSLLNQLHSLQCSVWWNGVCWSEPVSDCHKSIR